MNKALETKLAVFRLEWLDDSVITSAPKIPGVGECVEVDGVLYRVADISWYNMERFPTLRLERGR